jgi:hypothetical protein
MKTPKIRTFVLGAVLVLVGLLFETTAHAGLGHSASGLSGSGVAAPLVQATTNKIEWQVQGDQFLVYTSHGHKLRFFKSLKAQGQQRI